MEWCNALRLARRDIAGVYAPTTCDRLRSMRHASPIQHIVHHLKRAALPPFSDSALSFMLLDSLVLQFTQVISRSYSTCEPLDNAVCCLDGNLNIDNNSMSICYIITISHTPYISVLVQPRYIQFSACVCHYRSLRGSVRLPNACVSLYRACNFVIILQSVNTCGDIRGLPMGSRYGVLLVVSKRAAQACALVFLLVGVRRRVSLLNT